MESTWEGLFEFRVRHDERVIRGKAGESSAGKPTAVLLRIFCHAYGERIVLLLGGYDKGAAPSKKRQDAEIETARRRLRSFQTRVQASGRRAAAADRSSLGPYRTNMVYNPSMAGRAQ
jgi:hypothetical protein